MDNYPAIPPGKVVTGASETSLEQVDGEQNPQSFSWLF